MGMTTTLQNALLEQYFATEKFMSLHVASPSVGGSLAGEVSSVGTGYARQSLAGKLSSASGGYVTNTSTITFPTIAAAYGIVSDFATSDALASGVMGLFGSFTESTVKSVGQAYQFPPGTIRFFFK